VDTACGDWANAAVVMSNEAASAAGNRMTKRLPRDAEDGIPAMVDFEHPGISARSARSLDAAAMACAETAGDWVDAMTAEDRQGMVVAFYEAESLAAMALDQAITQVGPDFRDALVVQRTDESRHVDVFSRWGGAVRPLSAPRIRKRDDHVWFTLLLVNELTGYCQFMMLHALLESPGERQAVREICADEQEHIARLMGWMDPVMKSRRARACEAIVLRFRRGLEGRMHQFFPREELRPLRDAMSGHVDGLLETLFPGTGPAADGR